MEMLEEWGDMLKDFVTRNHSNPVLWIGIIVIGLTLFGFVYNSLSKNG